jgi:hypothetical protein
MARLKMSHQNWSDLHDFGRQLFLEGFIGGQGLCCGFSRSTDGGEGPGVKGL